MSALADGMKSDKVGYVRAAIHLPIGVTMSSVYCQLYDGSTTNDINVNVVERYSDDAGGIGQRVIFSFNSSGSGGHVKYWDTTASGSAMIRDYDGSGVSGGNRYYSYAVRAYLDGTSWTAVKSCAISY